LGCTNNETLVQYVRKRCREIILYPGFASIMIHE
jgi:hypothetical protein